MKLTDTQNKIFEYVIYCISFGFFLFFFGHALDYGRTYDDFALVDRFTKSPGDAKLISSFFYAKFHFYPVYFLTHELDNFFTFLLNFNGIEILNSKIAKFTNIFLHVTNSFLVYLLIKKVFKIEHNLKDNILIFLSSLIFLFHPITSQIIFNITTRNESLALFFGLLTFIYCISNVHNKRIINYFFISLLFFLSLCSKLMTIYLAGLIPLTIFLLNFHQMSLRENFKKNFDIFILLCVTFIVYYYLRTVFTEKNSLSFYGNFNDLLFYFLTSLKFYLIGLFFPYEHIYVYATNYDLGLSITVFILFLIFIALAFYLFFKKKDPILLISVFWIITSLTLPVMFGMIEKGFPLISNLAERYQYSSVVSVSLLLAWIFNNFFNHLYKKTLILGFYFLILLSSVFILYDRSKVYINNTVFMNQTDENSPRNTFRYSFTVDLKNAIISNDLKEYKFNLYQFYQLNTAFDEAILEFLRYYIHQGNEKGITFFENEFERKYQENPAAMFKLAKFFITQEKYEKAENQIKKIFEKYELVRSQINTSTRKVTFLDPPLDDLYFEIGKIRFYQKNYEAALENFKTANIINPLHATALYNAAIALKELGLNEDAIKLFKDAIEMNPFLRETASNLITETD
ncbi:tetratricopeptide repeat protein [Candidatus Pelagibacter sp.]|nr:tetratricopeptide repeat protein [Candidatus Pelagibacter sp.]